MSTLFSPYVTFSLVASQHCLFFASILFFSYQYILVAHNLFFFFSLYLIHFLFSLMKALFGRFIFFSSHSFQYFSPSYILYLSIPISPNLSVLCTVFSRISNILNFSYFHFLSFLPFYQYIGFIFFIFFYITNVRTPLNFTFSIVYLSIILASLVSNFSLFPYHILAA